MGCVCVCMCVWGRGEDCEEVCVRQELNFMIYEVCRVVTF